MAWIGKTFLAIAISIVFAVFIGYALFTFYEPPNRDWQGGVCWKNFDCERIGMSPECLNATLSGYGGEKTVPVVAPVPMNCVVAYDSAEYKTCIDNRQKCDDEYQKTTVRFKMVRNSFIVLVIIGLISIIFGMFLSSLEGIGSGFIGGGVLVIIWSLIYTAEYWTTLNKYMKLFALGLVLAVLIYFGYKRLDHVVNEKVVSVKRKKK